MWHSILLCISMCMRWMIGWVHEVGHVLRMQVHWAIGGLNNGCLHTEGSYLMSDEQ